MDKNVLLLVLDFIRTLESKINGLCHVYLDSKFLHDLQIVVYWQEGLRATWSFSEFELTYTTLNLDELTDFVVNNFNHKYGEYIEKEKKNERL